MDQPRLDCLARKLAALDRRRILTTFGTLVAAAVSGGLGMPHTALASCKKVGQNCDRNSDCCDHARCKSHKCRCRDGFRECDGKCHDLDTDEQHCGGCDDQCLSGRACCNGLCRDRDRDMNNCGSCGRVCPAGHECVAGECVLPGGGCPSGANACDAAPTVVCGTGGPTCHCQRSREGATVCIDFSLGISACGACRSSEDCASFGAGAICVDSIGSGSCCGGPPNPTHFCGLPCEDEP